MAGSLIASLSTMLSNTSSLLGILAAQGFRSIGEGGGVFTTAHSYATSTCSMSGTPAPLPLTPIDSLHSGFNKQRFVRRICEK
jgi:hypothetical protein